MVSGQLRNIIDHTQNAVVLRDDNDDRGFVTIFQKRVLSSDGP